MHSFFIVSSLCAYMLCRAAICLMHVKILTFMVTLQVDYFNLYQLA
jgi:hypothetical protein